MGVGVVPTGKVCAVSTVSCGFIRRSDFFPPRSLRKEGSNSRESEYNQDAASGLVSLVDPASWPGSKNSMLWVFC